MLKGANAETQVTLGFSSIGVNGHLDRSNFSRVKYWKSDWDIRKKK